MIYAPNQQGQDAVHLPQMLKFIFEYVPTGSQIIVATEDVGTHRPRNTDVSTYGERKRQVLREADYDDVRQIFEPYVRAILEIPRSP